MLGPPWAIDMFDAGSASGGIFGVATNSGDDGTSVGVGCEFAPGLVYQIVEHNKIL